MQPRDGIWSVVKDIDKGVVRVKALALRKELAKYGLTSEEEVKRAWKDALRHVQGFNGGLSVRLNVKFLNVYCLTEIEVARKAERGNGGKRRKPSKNN